MTTTTTTPPDSRRLQFLDDYCPRCNPAGHHADSRVRRATLTEPDAVTWHGSKGVLCEYQCDRCGHAWTRSDLWDAQCAGFKPVKENAA